MNRIVESSQNAPDSELDRLRAENAALRQTEREYGELILALPQGVLMDALQRISAERSRGPAQFHEVMIQ